MSFPSRYKAAIFDLDGTLADSMAAWDHIASDWSRQNGHLPPPDLDKTVRPMTPGQSSQYIIGLYGLDLSPEELRGQWAEMIREKYRDSIPLKPGAADALKALAAKGIPMALATSCFPDACEAFLEKHRIKEYFRAVLYTDQVGRDKTYPDVYLACAKALDVPPEHCLVFEDIYSAIKGVRAAGMGFAAVYDEKSASNWERMKAEADLVFKSFAYTNF